MYEIFSIHSTEFREQLNFIYSDTVVPIIIAVYSD